MIRDHHNAKHIGYWLILAEVKYKQVGDSATKTLSESCIPLLLIKSLSNIFVFKWSKWTKQTGNSRYWQVLLQYGPCRPHNNQTPDLKDGFIFSERQQLAALTLLKAFFKAPMGAVGALKRRVMTLRFNEIQEFTLPFERRCQNVRLYRTVQQGNAYKILQKI